MIDAFADADTAACCSQLLTAPVDQWGFEPRPLIALINKLDLSQCCGVVYGSGFEARPNLLADLAALLPIIGNPAQVVSQVKSSVFFERLRQLNIPHPVTYFSPLSLPQEVLVKAIGGSGGSHIRHKTGARDSVESVDFVDSDDYFQVCIDGTPVSLLFLASKRGIEVIGFNQQWVNPASMMPYRYGGAVGHADLSACVKAQLVSAAEKLASAFDLRGLNSLDAMVKLSNGQEQVLVLEINPRLSASIDLYAHAQQNLLMRHVSACLGFEGAGLIDVAGLIHVPAIKSQSVSKACAVVYAPRDLRIGKELSWPEWVQDRPYVTGQSVFVQSGQPLCTVHALAPSAAVAKDLAQHRVREILAMMS